MSEQELIDAERERGGEHAHPGPAEYVKIAIWLAIATALEVVLYYMEQAEMLPPSALVALLMFFMIVKFALVALWFMHLKFDEKVFRQLFVAGILLATAVYAIVLLTFGVFLGDRPWIN